MTARFRNRSDAERAADAAEAHGAHTMILETAGEGHLVLPFELLTVEGASA